MGGFNTIPVARTIEVALANSQRMKDMKAGIRLVLALRLAQLQLSTLLARYR